MTVAAEIELMLIEPSLEYEAEFLEMVNEFDDTGDDNYRNVPELATGDVAAYIARLHDQSRGIGLPPGRVPATSYWLVRADRTVLGASQLRHGLTPDLEHEGGHVGYRIRPSQRRKGYGTRLLALTLDKARERGMRRVLVTCDSDNLASARIIQKNGGKLENEVISVITGRLVSRYWVEL